VLAAVGPHRKDGRQRSSLVPPGHAWQRPRSDIDSGRNGSASKDRSETSPNDPSSTSPSPGHPDHAVVGWFAELEGSRWGDSQCVLEPDDVTETVPRFTALGFQAYLTLDDHEPATLGEHGVTAQGLGPALATATLDGFALGAGNAHGVFRDSRHQITDLRPPR
jgi:hypothetical protein